MTEQGTSRRRFLTGAAAAGVGAAAGFAAGYGVRGVADADAVPQAVAAQLAAVSDNVVPFYGARQAGVTTPQQERLMFAAFDVSTTDVEELKRMLGRWSAMAARMTQGKQVSDSPTKPAQPPFDTGESLDLGAHSLTITVGFGPSLFDDRFGLADRRPPELAPSARSRATRSCGRSCPTATCACRPVPTIRRSSSTRSGTWPGPRAAPPRCAGPSSASAGPRRPVRSR